MFPSLGESYMRHVVRQEFEHSHRHSTLNKIWSKIIGRRFSLLDLREVQRTVHARTKSYAGLQWVSVGQIVGSEGRSRDFDRAWRPLKMVSRQRWMNIAVARTQGVNMPAVDLIQIGDMYFVRDGHHRISVAKAQGQLEIEANVFVWHPVAGPSEDMNGCRAGETPVNYSLLAAKTVQGITVVKHKFMTISSKIRSSCSSPPLITKA